MTPIIISIISVTISAVSVFCAIFFSAKSSKRTDVNEIETRTQERVETKLKLDEIGRNVSDIKYDISATRKDVQQLFERVTSVESSVKSEHKRLDRVERVLDLRREDLDDANT